MAVELKKKKKKKMMMMMMMMMLDQMNLRPLKVDGRSNNGHGLANDIYGGPNDCDDHGKT